MASPQPALSGPRTVSAVNERLELVNWHILRGDQLRAGVASRAGAILSTNALVVAGIALAFSLLSRRPSIAVVVLALAALGCVVFSVNNAALAMVSVRSWQRQFSDDETPAAFLYCHAEIGGTSNTFEDFKRKVTTASPDELLGFALTELWRCGRLHEYRYRKIRVATCWLFAALVLFLAAAAVSAFR